VRRAEGSVAEELAAFYARQKLPADGGSSARRWRVELPGFSLPMPNFAWRSRALPVHDLHHLVTGYPCSPTGEFEMAAWEFAAGRFPHAGATAFCLPLVGFGAVLRPRRTLAAFVRGRSSRTLYACGLTSEVLDSPLSRLRERLLPDGVPGAGPRDLLAYAAWVAASLAWSAVPLLAVAGAILLLA